VNLQSRLPTGATVAGIFRSFQGEGPLAGSLQIFIRFAGCDRACAFCDTPEARVHEGEKTVVALGAGRRWKRPNPWTPEDLEATVADFGDLPVWLTGGEPLLQERFLLSFLPRLEGRRDVGLETHALNSDAMTRVAPLVRWVSADAKLPSSTGEALDWEAFSRSLEAASGRELYVKAVITSTTSEEEVEELFRRLEALDPSTPLYLQPVTPVRGVEAPDAGFLEALVLAGLSRLETVRVLPQVHRLAGWK